MANNGTISVCWQALKIKSSHDVLTEDPKLSSQPAVVETSTESR